MGVFLYCVGYINSKHVKPVQILVFKYVHFIVLRFYLTEVQKQGGAKGFDLLVKAIGGPVLFPATKWTREPAIKQCETFRNDG